MVLSERPLYRLTNEYKWLTDPFARIKIHFRTSTKAFASGPSVVVGSLRWRVLRGTEDIISRLFACYILLFERFIVRTCWKGYHECYYNLSNTLQSFCTMNGENTSGSLALFSAASENIGSEIAGVWEYKWQRSKTFTEEVP